MSQHRKEEERKKANVEEPSCARRGSLSRACAHEQRGTVEQTQPTRTVPTFRSPIGVFVIVIIPKCAVHVGGVRIKAVLQPEGAAPAKGLCACVSPAAPAVRTVRVAVLQHPLECNVVFVVTKREEAGISRVLNAHIATTPIRGHKDRTRTGNPSLRQQNHLARRLGTEYDR